MKPATISVYPRKFPKRFVPIPCRRYSTQSLLGTSILSTKRKPITVLNDNGFVPWKELSVKEKAARLTQQSFNLSIIILGAALSGGVAYVMYTNVFSPESRISHYNRALDQVMRDNRCVSLLGETKGISLNGNSISTSWGKSNSNLTSRTMIDQKGIEHLLMKFDIDGTKARGVVNLHMVKSPSDSKFVYKYLALDVTGNPRIYVENAKTIKSNSNKGFKLFGVHWN